MGTPSLPDVLGPVFEIGLEVGHELARVGTVDGAVVKAQREALDAADGDAVLAVLVGEHHGFLVQAADAEENR